MRLKNTIRLLPPHNPSILLLSHTVPASPCFAVSFLCQISPESHTLYLPSLQQSPGIQSIQVLQQGQEPAQQDRDTGTLLSSHIFFCCARISGMPFQFFLGVWFGGRLREVSSPFPVPLSDMSQTAHPTRLKTPKGRSTGLTTAGAISICPAPSFCIPHTTGQN